MRSRLGDYFDDAVDEADALLDDDEEPSGLTRASFVIPCAPQRRGLGDNVSTRECAAYFKPIAPFEEKQGPRLARSTALQQQRQCLLGAAERTCSQILAPFANELERTLLNDPQSSTPRYFYPGCPGSNVQTLGLVALLGPPISSSFLSKCIQECARKHEALVVTLSARECASLRQVLQIISARAQLAQEDPSQSDPGKHVVVRILDVERVSGAVLNDVLKALHSLAAEDDGPQAIHYTVLVDAASGSASLEEKLYPDSLAILDLRRIPICKLPVRAFELFVEELTLKKADQSHFQLILGPAMLSFLRKLFFEKRTNLDEVVSAIDVALLRHFTSHPESAFVTLSQSSSLSDYSSEYATRLRDLMCGTDVHLQETLARHESFARSRQEALRSLQRILTDDNLTFDAAKTASRWHQARQVRFTALAQMIHTIRVWLSVKTVSSADESVSSHYYTAPRSSELGGIVFALLSGRSVRAILHDLPMTLRRRTFAQLEELWNLLQKLDKMRFSARHVAVTEVFERVMDQNASSADEGEDSGGKDGAEQMSDDPATNDVNTRSVEASRQEQRRLERVQRQLEKQEQSSRLKTELVEALFSCLEDIVPKLSPLERSIFVLDSGADVQMLLDPAPRAHVIAGLADPAAYLDAGKDVPDVCHAFQTYRDAGRLINLADWYAAFEQSIQNSRCIPTGGTSEKQVDLTERHADNDGHKAAHDLSNGTELHPSSQPSHNDEHTQRAAAAKRAWQEPDMLQIRFSLAVHELGRMGFLKRTRRKADHILKLVHDLPPSKVQKMDKR